MVDFSKYVSKTATARPIEPIALFQTLDRKASHVSLRLAQQQVLEMLHARRAERDHVLKMPTGTGKSSVGLIYLASHMFESRKPAVYLCPTVQLVDQVLAEAALLGIEAHRYPRKERYPHANCGAAQAITVCTYDKLFNAHTTFDRDDVMLTPCAIVLDDAHSGVEEVRDAFTVRCTGSELVEKLLKILDPAGRAYSPGMWDDILAGKPDAAMEIPYWSWRTVLADVRTAISAHEEEDSITFSWGYISNSLRWCRCVVDSTGIEIAPLLPFVERVRAFANAPHRLFMSATLADDAVLVRELACSPSAAKTPLVPTSEGGLGERMVLAPSLLSPNLTRPWLMQWCSGVAKKYNVVVLCSSGKQAAEWAAVGAVVASDDAVAAAVKQLKAGALKFVAFPQRYDGIDLADDACRVLVIDGVPFGQGIIDRFDSASLTSPGGVRSRTITRIEQGMGRAVRSNADYAVVILGGPDLAAFTARIDVQDRMSPDIRLQSDLARVLAEMATDEPNGDPAANFDDLVRKCLARDPHWKSFYDARVRKLLPAAGTAAQAVSAIDLADAERRSVVLALDGDAPSAFTGLDAALTAAGPSEAARAPFLQVLANLKNESNPGESGQLQRAAYERGRHLLKPPPGFSIKAVDPQRWRVAAKVLEAYGEYADANGLVAFFHTQKPLLAFGIPAKRFESAFAAVARIIGAESSRPDLEGALGPDNLLLWPELTLVVEAKNEAEYDEIPKKDAAQLHHSIAWCKGEYAARDPIAVLISPTLEAAKGVTLPKGTRVMTPELLGKYVASLEAFVVALATKPVSAWQPKHVDELLDQHGLSASRFIGRFTKAAR